MIAIQIQALNLITGAVETLRYADIAYMTSPSDVPPNAYFDARIADSPSLARSLFEGDATYGASKASPGSVDLVNNDGALDKLLTSYAYDGRAFEIRQGQWGVTPFANWPVIMSGVLDDVSVSDEQVKIAIRDRLASLAVPVPRSKYAGSNVLPDGVEGVASDLKAQYKPRVYGSVLNVTPKCVNTSKLIYQVSDQTCAVSACYDNGSALTRDADFASLALLLSTTVTAGHFRCYQGYIKVGTKPTALTCDAATTEQRAAPLMQQIAIDSGIPAADISATDVTALLAANSAVVGVWLDGDDTAQSLLDALAGSVGAWYGFDRLNKMRMTLLQLPASSSVPVATYTVDQITDFEIGAAGVPVWGVIVQWGHNYTQQTQLASSLTADRVTWLSLEYRQSASEDATVKTAWPSSEELTFETALINQADADSEAARRRALYGARRITFSIEIPVSQLGSVDLGSFVSVNYGRYGVTGGLYVCIGLDSGADTETAKLTLWG